VRAFAHVSLVLVLACAPLALSANPELGWRIAELTRRIAIAPEDATLYLRRGELRRSGHELEAARADLDEARRLAPGMPGLELAYARLWLDAGRPERAAGPLDALLAREPQHVQALVLRGRARAALGDPLAGAEDLSAALRYSARPTPELYLERAALLQSRGDAQLGAALAGLDEGVARLGPAYVLVRAALELEVERERYAGALARFEALPEAVRQRPAWQARRGDWLVALGREAEADEAYRAARAALHADDARRRSSAEAADLERRIAAALATR